MKMVNSIIQKPILKQKSFLTVILINNKEKFKQQKWGKQKELTVPDQTKPQYLAPARLRASGLSLAPPTGSL